MRAGRSYKRLLEPGEPAATGHLLPLLVVMLAACYGSPAAEPVSVEPTTAAPLPPVDERPAGETKGPLTYAPDWMWAYLASAGDGMRQSDTLAGAVEFAELVVVGRYVGVERGTSYGSDWTAVALIAVDDVIKGAPNLGPDGLLRVEFVLTVGAGSYPERLFADLERSIPSDPALLYLFSWAAFFDLTGEVVPDWRAGIDRTDRYKTIGGDGAIRIVNGRIEPPPDGWPAELRGIGIEQAKDLIRAAIRPPGPPASPAP